MRNITNSRLARARLPVAILSTAFALGIAASAPASAATKEVNLATPAQALAYCQSGKMPGSDIAYISGGPRLVQNGPNSNCTQTVSKKILVKKAILASGNHVAECNLAPTGRAVSFCEGGQMGTWDIDYISGEIGKTISGPGYGCGVNYSSSSIGNAVCK